MPETVTQAYIFVPMLVVVALSIIVFFRMAKARAGVIKEMDAAYYRAHLGGQEPEVAVVAVRHYGNMFEAPTLFYAACISAFVLQGVGWWTVLFAWGYALLRLVQSAVHATYNNPAHRGIAFMLSMVFLIALWVNIAMTVFAQI